MPKSDKVIGGTMNQNSSNPKIREIAERLVAHESADAPNGETPAVFHVCEKLRPPLSNLAGANGFRLLLTRALKLTKDDAPMLCSVEVKGDGSLDGLGKTSRNEAAETGALLIAQLIGLLVTFIGENLTLRLLQDIWPDLPGLDIDAGRKETK